MHYGLQIKESLSYQKSKLNEERLDRILENAGFDKYRYQVDAVAQAIQKLDEFNGVIIADVIGLGKSVIASLVGAMRRRRGLIICPPGLMGDKSGATGGVPDSVEAVEAVNKLRPRLSSDLKLFASMVLEDVQNYGTILARTISNIAKCGRGGR